MIPKISSMVSVVLLTSGLWAGALAQAQQQPQTEHHAPSAATGSHGMAGTPRAPSAQAQPRMQSQAIPRTYGAAGAPLQGQYRPPAAAHPHPNGYGPGYYRSPVAAAQPRYYRGGSPGYYSGYYPPGVAVMPAFVAGSMWPYGYGDYPMIDWGYYNLPPPCCGQYWVQYGPNFLLISPDGMVLQVFTP